MIDNKLSQNVEILLVEDNPGDIRLIVEVLKEGKIHNNLSVVEDGEEALAYLRREGSYQDAIVPDIILLDLNLPKINGTEVLAEIKKDPLLKYIPVIILTTSEAEQDILRAYDLACELLYHQACQPRAVFNSRTID